MRERGERERVRVHARAHVRVSVCVSVPLALCVCGGGGGGGVGQTEIRRKRERGVEMGGNGSDQGLFISSQIVEEHKAKVVLFSKLIDVATTDTVLTVFTEVVVVEARNINRTFLAFAS